jgi:hypothetical protein
VRPLDTTEEADRIQFEIWRTMSADEKLRRIFECSELLRTTFEDGIRDRHPGYTDHDVRMARIRHELGDALFRQVYPHEALRHP